MVRTAAHRGDRRPYCLIVVARNHEDLLFREELAGCAVSSTSRSPRSCAAHSPGGTGHRRDQCRPGDRRTRHRPQIVTDLDYFLCGPPAPVIDTLEALGALGVPPERVHTEQFEFV